MIQNCMVYKLWVSIEQCYVWRLLDLCLYGKHRYDTKLHDLQIMGKVLDNVMLTIIGIVLATYGLENCKNN